MLVVGGDNLIDLIEISRDDAAVSFAGARGGSGYNTAQTKPKTQANIIALKNDGTLIPIVLIN